MIIAVTASEKDPNSIINNRFGRCSFFYIYDTDKKEGFFIDNTQNINAAHGAGIQAAQIIVNNNTENLITINVGPKAFKVLNNANIKTYQADTNSTLNQAIENLLSDKLELLQESNT